MKQNGCHYIGTASAYANNRLSTNLFNCKCLLLISWIAIDYLTIYQLFLRKLPFQRFCIFVYLCLLWKTNYVAYNHTTADVSAPDGANPSTSTVLTTKLDYLLQRLYSSHLGWLTFDDVIQNGRRVPTTSRGTSSFNSLWPSDAIWQHRSGSTLAQVMARCLTAPSHHLNQCWLRTSMVRWHSYEGRFTRDTSAIDD